MLSIICGEDVVSSRNYVISLRKQYASRNFAIKDVNPSEIGSLTRWLGESQTLFSEKKVFFSENLNRHIRRDNKKILDELKKIEKLKDVELIDWESVSLWELKLAKAGRVKEFRLKENVFKLLDSLYPTNKREFILLLHSVAKTDDPHFIFTMLVRHIRALILVKEAVPPKRLQPWQIRKLQFQAGFWKLENLVNFYEALLKIEIGEKTGSNPYSLKDSLAILACHFL